ncbi:MAG: hypothetical protein K0S86_1378 [Geminicoccaceae bacterium]|nr:hypothetical protein [Geminicoccaceae bacterium]
MHRIRPRSVRPFLASLAILATPAFLGAQASKGVRGVGGLVSIAVPDADAEAADTLEGPWGEAAVDLDGALAFLTGDRPLRISYGTSSNDAARAVQLARPAVDRLASAR